MAAKFQNKCRGTSARLQNWDYRWAASYFITICTKDRLDYFGEIYDSKMKLSNAGVLADVFWREIKNHANDLQLGEFMVMPNHIHGILILNGNDNNVDIVGQTHAFALQCPQPNKIEQTKTIGQQRFQNQGKNSVSSIIGGYKCAVTKQKLLCFDDSTICHQTIFGVFCWILILTSLN